MNWLSCNLGVQTFKGVYTHIWTFILIFHIFISLLSLHPLNEEIYTYQIVSSLNFELDLNILCYFCYLCIIVQDLWSIYSTDSMCTQGASTSSPSFSSTRRWKYDVFLNFRGVDTHSNFTDHLYVALKQKGILTFKYD